MAKSSARDMLRFRTVFISDVHLGFRGCSADSLLDFLRSVECERLYLVGDIVHIWTMRKRPFWPLSHNNVVRTILEKAKHDTEVILVPIAARRCDADGVICGRIHHAQMRDIDSEAYLNCGDWVESCTAPVENDRGEVQIPFWEHREQAPAEVKAAA